MTNNQFLDTIEVQHECSKPENPQQILHFIVINLEIQSRFAVYIGDTITFLGVAAAYIDLEF